MIHVVVYSSFNKAQVILEVPHTQDEQKRNVDLSSGNNHMGMWHIQKGPCHKNDVNKVDSLGVRTNYMPSRSITMSTYVVQRHPWQLLVMPCGTSAHLAKKGKLLISLKTLQVHYALDTKGVS